MSELNLHGLKNAAGARRPRKRKGRGPASGTGKTAGRGHKGFNSRSGSSTRAGFEGGQMPMTRRVPKRGFKPPHRTEYAILNLDALCRFDPGTEVSPALVKEVGLVRNLRDGLKILGTGTIDRPLRVRAHSFSQTARARIEEAGGSCEVIAN